MKVLHVVWEYPPVMYGGLARHAEALALAQHAAGHEVTVVTAAEDVTDPDRKVPAAVRLRRDVRVHRARRAAPRLPWSDLLGAATQLSDALTAGGLAEAAARAPDVVHAHDWTAARAGRAIADAAGVPLVLTVHATEYGRRLGRVDPAVEGGVPATIHGIERAAVTGADAVLVCSRAMRLEVREVLGANPDRVAVIPNAVNVAAWRCGAAAVRAARRHWLGEAADDGLLIAAAGRLEWEKGFSTLLRAVPDLIAAGRRPRVVLAGRGSDAPRLEGLAEQLDIAGVVTMPGWLSRRDLAALYSAADVVAVPSRYEPYGLVAREAQAAGAAVVAAAVGGLLETVRDGVDGLLIGVGDVHGLRDRVLALTADPQLGRRLGAAAAREVEDWTWGGVAAATGEIYRRVRSGEPVRDRDAATSR